MSDDDELPWPHCLGFFDEESCRYFLHDIGKRIVPFYPFSFGMEEVYTSIIDRYGISECTDAIAVLQELLEDEQNAGGLGDDGDIWRSWRHGWRHRNDDRSNPFIPRVGNQMLPPPTSFRIRRLKATNFTSRLQSAAVRESGQVEEIQTAKSNVSGHRNHAIHCDIEKPQMHKSRDFFSRVRRSSTIPTLDDLRISEGCLRVSRPELVDDRASNLSHTPRISACLSSNNHIGEARFLALRGGNSQTVSPGYKHTSVDSSRHSPAGSGGPVLSRKSVDRSRAGSSPLRDLSSHFESDSEFTTGPGEVGTTSRRWDLGPYIGASSDHMKLATDKHSKTGEIVGVATDTSQFETTASPDNKRRTVNRQARLVDGTIFTLCTKKPHTVGQAHTDVEQSLQGIDSRKSIVAVSPPPGRKDTRRVSWLQGLRAILHHEKSERTYRTRKRRRSAPVNPSTTASTSTIMAPPSPARPKNTLLSTPQNYSCGSHAHFDLDGACDDTVSSISGINLNKPLPLNPEDAVRSMSNRTSVASPAASSKPPSSTASLASSTFSGLWSRNENVGKVQELSDCTFPGSHELPPISEDRTGSWASCDPPKSPEPPVSPKSWKNFAIRNPWEDVRTPRSSLATPQCVFSETADSVEETHKPRGLPLSHSEPRLQYATFDTRQVLEPVPLRLARHTKRQQDETGETRGREQQQSISLPSQENKQLETPLKRSRSPVKRLLGLGKSESTNTITVNESPPRPKTPKTPTSKKNSIKKWGDRLRYGFLAADQDQIRQEELIEQHMNNLDTPPSQKSTFPVSLEPPHQAKAHSEMELIITVTANRYLLKEARAGRLSAESVSRLKNHWHSMGRPQVIEFHYDQLTQHGLIVANLKTVRLHGDAAKDPLQINSTLHGWKMMAKEMSVRTLCDPDSVIRKHLHDGHRVLELLGAPFVTFLAYDDMQVKTLARISARQKDRMSRKGGSAHGRSYSDGSRVTSGLSRRNFSDGSHDFQYTAESFQMDKINLAPSPTPTPRMKPRKPTGAENAIMTVPLPMPMMRTRPHESRVADQYDESRGGRLGKTIREKPEDLLL